MEVISFVALAAGLIIGLGAIGVKVANAAVELGMEVFGFDPAMTVNNAERRSVQSESSISTSDRWPISPSVAWM